MKIEDLKILSCRELEPSIVLVLTINTKLEFLYLVISF